MNKVGTGGYKNTSVSNFFSPIFGRHFELKNGHLIAHIYTYCQNLWYMHDNCGVVCYIFDGRLLYMTL